MALTDRGRRTALARFYDLDTRDVSYDAELYLSLAHEVGGDVLELAVGSGRLAIPLALAGHRVVGVDDDRAMLARARAAWAAQRGGAPAKRLTLVEGDMATFRADGAFGLSLLAVNTFLLAADDPARSAILETMRRHLRPGGLAAIEFATPGRDELDDLDGRVHLEWLRTDPETGAEVSKYMAARHDPDAGTVELTQIFEWTPVHGGVLSRVTRADTLHLVAPAHVARLARQVGFGNVEVRGDHLLMPHGARSHRAIVLARLV
jgi:SAM-dependent methyltransferase